jgi:hypothetical protein
MFRKQFKGRAWYDVSMGVDPGILNIVGMGLGPRRVHESVAELSQWESNEYLVELVGTSPVRRTRQMRMWAQGLGARRSRGA